MLSFIVLCAMGSWPFFSWLDLGKVGYLRSWHCWDGGCFSLGMSIWIQMHAKPSSSTWPQIPVILEGGEGGLHQERWLGAVGQLNRVERVCNSRASLLMYAPSQAARELGLMAMPGNLSWNTGFGLCKELEEGGLLQNAPSSAYHRDQDGFRD